MIDHANADGLRPVEQPTPLHRLNEQLTLVKGWTQLVTRYSMEDRPRHEDDIRKGLTRIDAATTRLTELLADVLLCSGASTAAPKVG